MIKHILFGAASLALIAGTSIAQEAQVTTQERTVIDRPAGNDTVNSQTTTRSTDGLGDQHTVSRDVVRQTDGEGDQSVTHKTTTTNTDAYGDRSSSTTVQKTTDR